MVLYSLVGQEAAKILEVKVGGWNRNCLLSRSRSWYAWGRLNWEIFFFQYPTLTSDIFCNLFTHKSVKYLIWKIWFIPVWREKSKVVAWLLKQIPLCESQNNAGFTEPILTRPYEVGGQKCSKSCPRGLWMTHYPYSFSRDLGTNSLRFLLIVTSRPKRFSM